MGTISHPNVSINQLRFWFFCQTWETLMHYLLNMTSPYPRRCQRIIRSGCWMPHLYCGGWMWWVLMWVKRGYLKWLMLWGIILVTIDPHGEHIMHRSYSSAFVKANMNINCRFNTHVMMGLANGKVKQAASRLTLAQEMLEVYFCSWRCK